MPQFVKAQLLRKNSLDFDCDNKSIALNCENIQVLQVLWRQPILGGGRQTGWSYKYYAARPSVDAVKVLKLRDISTNDIFFIAIQDAADVTAFTDACNACCASSTPALATVTIPTIFFEEAGTPDASGNYYYAVTTSPTPPAGGVYRLSGSANGAALTTAPAAGFASLSALETWADANWNTNGMTGVTISGGTVTLNGGQNVKSASISVTIDQFFTSNVPGALTAGQNYSLAATVNGNVLPVIASEDNEALSVLVAKINNTPSHYAYGIWSENAGAIRLTKTGVTLTSATLTVSKV